MLSISKAAGGGYYTSIAGGASYYINGGEMSGKWYGEGAKREGFSGTISSQKFENFFSGMTENGHKMFRNSGTKMRRNGYDLTFSAPKTVSVLYAQSSKSYRNDILKSHEKATKQALDYIQDKAGFVRIDAHTKRAERAALSFGLFTHTTSRALDCQLHTHAVCINAARDSSGKWRSIESDNFYIHKMTGGAVYRAALAGELRKIGYQIEEDREFFKVSGVPESLCEAHSKRREEILEQMRKTGYSSQSALDTAAVTTRDTKTGKPNLSELFTEWQSWGDKEGFTTQDADNLRGISQKRERVKDNLLLAYHEINEQLHENKSYTREQDVLKAWLKIGIKYGFTYKECEKAAARHVDTLVCLGEDNGEKILATKEHIVLEYGVYRLIDELNSKDTVKDITDKQVDKILRQNKMLSDDQREALKNLAQSSQVAALIGDAGAGKSTTLGVLKEVYESSGYQIIAAAPTHKACRGLANQGFDTVTVAKLLKDWGKEEYTERKPQPVEDFKQQEEIKRKVSKLDTFKANLAYATHQIGEKELNYLLKRPLSENVKILDIALQATGKMSRAEFKYRDSLRTKNNAEKQEQKALRQEQKALDRGEKPDKKKILIIDEASMVSMKDFSEILKRAKERGLHVVMSGDYKQLHGIAAGGGFRELCERIKPAHLTEVHRQKGEEAKLVRGFGYGDAKKSFKSLKDQGRLSIAKDVISARSTLIKDWLKVDDKSKTLIITPLNSNVDALNRKAQEAMKNAGALGASIKHKDGFTIHQGDRLLVKNNTQQAKNNDLCTVLEVDAVKKTVKLKIDDVQEPVIYPVDKKQSCKLGYAITVHASQGTTAQNVFVLLGDKMQDANMVYTEMSRHKDGLKVYGDELSIGKDLEKIIRSSDKSGEQESAQSVAVRLMLKEEVAKEQAQEKTQVSELEAIDKLVEAEAAYMQHLEEPHELTLMRSMEQTL